MSDVKGLSGLVMLPSQLTLVCGGQLEALAWVQPQHTQELIDCSRRVLGLHHQHVPRSVPAEQREEGALPQMKSRPCLRGTPLCEH